MLGGMQDWPLLVGRFLDYAATSHPRVEVVSKAVEGGVHRYTYADMHLRTRKLSQALKRLGISEGECVGTLAWNTYRHVETW
jgi:fatty-acyl-CoA synthase